MERSILHTLVDGCSTSLVDVGLQARVQRKECLPPTVGGKHLFLSCKHLCSDISHPSSQILSSFHSVRKYFRGCQEITMMEQVTLLIPVHVTQHTCFSNYFFGKLDGVLCIFHIGNIAVTMHANCIKKILFYHPQFGLAFQLFSTVFSNYFCQF